MTNLLNLPQIPAGTTITIDHNVDWYDQFSVSQPGFLANSIPVTGTLDGSTGVITGISSTAGIVPGMLAVAYGIPINATVSSVASSTVTINANTTVAASLTVTFYPPPLDLTGITFSSKLRLAATSSSALLAMSTTNGLMTNSGTTGKFGWAVPAASLPPWPAQLASQGTLSCVLDVQATDVSNALVNLCSANGPIAVTVNLAVTR